MNHINHEKLAAMIDEARSQHPEETLPELIFRAYHRYDALNPRPSFWRRLWLMLIGSVLLLVALAAGAQTGSVNLDRIGQVKVSGDDVIDTTNHAVRTNCVIGCSASGGGGAAQLQVRNAGDTAWVNVGFNVSNLTLPVTLQTGAATIGAISNTSFAATQGGTWNVGTLTSITNPVAVTGTFFQATQPVSSTQLPAALDGSGFLKVHEQGTVPVTGTFFQATQPVSGTVAATQSGTWTVQPGNTANTTAWKVDGSAVTQPVSGTVTANQGTSPWVVSCSTANCPQPTLTKGTQGATGYSTQDLKDSGRTYVVLSASLLTGVTTEALATFTKNVNGTATTAQTAYTITSGKTFRIQSISALIKNTTTTINNLVLNVRVAASVAASSPIVASVFCAAPSGTATSSGQQHNDYPDGIEIAGNGSLQIGISHVESVTTASITSFTLVGYEY